jgi:site-specific recombinase XerD
LAGYTANTRTSYTTDLRLFASWCAGNGVRLLAVKRAHLELFARHMEAEGRMRSTVARRLSTLASFYRYCHVEGVLRRNPAANVRRPKVDHESRTLGLDRNELGALLVQAGLGTARDHALIALLALNGLRISEALGADIGHLDIDRGHRTLRIVRKGGKQVTIPLAPRTARALDLYVGERAVGPIFITADGRRMDRSAADRTVKRLARRAGSTSGSRLTVCATPSLPPRWTPGWRCVTSKRRHRMPILARRCVMTVGASRSTGTPPTSSPPSSPAPRGRADPTIGRAIPGTGTARPRRISSRPLRV